MPKEPTPPRLELIGDQRGARVEPLHLGRRVREIRQSRNWTLEEASRRTGLARSTLSKIENEQMSPTFDAVQKLAQGLDIDVPQLFAPPRRQASAGRRTITRTDEGQSHPTATYEHELLCTDLTNKRMVPFKSRIRARSFADFADWVRHDGEEFVLVLSGAVELYSEYYAPVGLNMGDSAYFDSAMGHALVSVSEEDAQVLWVTSA
ncbi:MAG: XRE family transcriptional regulator [Pseudomonadota bacterium]